jgi:hypothetical protein
VPRLGALESELFVDDTRFNQRAKLRPDPTGKALFVQEISRAERLSDAALKKSAGDANALFVKSLTSGLRAGDPRGTASALSGQRALHARTEPHR